MRSRILVLLLLAALPTVAEPAAGPAPEPVSDPAPAPHWPLDLGTRYLTSSFMERRPGRYHAGLDLKTDSRTGFAVRAVEDGYVSRVRAEAGAYGRAVYVQGVSGRTTVYAHLARFSDRIMTLVDADRAKSGAYRVRLEPGPDAIPVRAGDVLGLSGESGTEGPHLHFEVRDGAQRPLDPQQWGFAVTDTFAPVIAALTAHAAALPAAGVPEAVAVRADGPLPAVLPSLAIAGPVAFSARITDQGDIRGHVLEPSLIEVYLDGARVYRCRNEAFAFDQNNELRLEWCDIVDADGRSVLREHWLFRRDGVRVPGREGGAWHRGAGGAGLAPGAHELRLEASDMAGNRSTVTVPLVVGAPAADGAVALGGAGWAPVAAGLVDAAGNRLTPFFRQGEPEGGAVRQLDPRDPAAPAPLLAPADLWIVPWSSATDTTRRPAPELEGPYWGQYLLAADWPVDGRLHQEAPGAPADSDLWIFRWDRTRWKPVGPLHQDGGAPWYEAGERGLHAAFRDRSAPWIDPAALQVTAAEPSTIPGVTLPRFVTLPVAVVDRGTGVDAGTIAAALDGAPLIVEPDLVRDRVLVTVPDGTAPGRHELRLEAADEAGNRAVRRVSVEVR